MASPPRTSQDEASYRRMPSRMAPDAPAKPISEKAWATNAERRRTTKYPVTPAMIAIIVPSRKHSA